MQYAFMFYSYLKQLEAEADRRGVRLLDACIHAGIEDSTYYRWMNKRFSPSEAVARAVFEAIGELHDRA